MTERVLVVTPMKAFDQAKSRLAEVMADSQRERLARALFLRTQRFFASHYAGFDRLVVTPSPLVAQLARQVGTGALLEPGADGLNVACGRAIRWATGHGYSSILLIPGDVPVWVRREVNVLLDHGRRHRVVIAQSRDGGTNALLLKLPTAFNCRYGPDSSHMHLRSARDAGLSAVLCKLPFLAHDLDVPADCAILASKRQFAQEEPS